MKVTNLQDKQAATAPFVRAESPNMPPALTLNEEEIRTWLVTRLGKIVRLQPQEVNVDRAFAEFGLDSVQAARLAGDLEKWLGRELSPSLVYDYPTIAGLARHLAAELAATPLTEAVEYPTASTPLTREHS